MAEPALRSSRAATELLRKNKITIASILMYSPVVNSQKCAYIQCIF